MTTVLDSGPLAIGSRVLPSRYFLSPLAGYTQLPFRVALRELGGLGLATTDLVLAHTLLHGAAKSLSLVETRLEDRPLSVQIYGGDGATLVAAAKWLEDRGYGGVDINMGCPMGKLNRAARACPSGGADGAVPAPNGRGGGARLLRDADAACRSVARVVESVRIPVTVKMRLGWDRDSITAPGLARALEQVGVAAITIHGRTRQQGFHGEVDLEGIRRTVEAVERIPVIGNGDVRSADEAFFMRRATGCAAVAIGRGAMLDPWIFRKIAAADAGRPVREPSHDERIDFLIRHFTLMTEQHAEYGSVLFRKFAAWYGARLGIPEDLEDRLRRLQGASEFHEIAGEIRQRPGERRTRIPTALVKVPNGPVERW